MPSKQETSVKEPDTSSIGLVTPISGGDKNGYMK